jgi:hypothetical protein
MTGFLMFINVGLLEPQKYHGKAHCKALSQQTHTPVVNTCTAIRELLQAWNSCRGVYIKHARPIESVCFDGKPRKPEEEEEGERG